MVQGLEGGIEGGIECSIEKDIERSKRKLLIATISIALFSTGIFVVIWGISSYVDSRFSMQGLGFFLVGMTAVSIGILLYEINR